MTPKEAKNILTENLGNIAEHCGAAVGTAAAEALKACEYRIGKRVGNYETSGSDCQSGFCPTCGGFESNLHSDCSVTVCRNCGQLLDWQLSRCIVTKCVDCKRHSSDGAVCPHYADKADEIRRVHTEEQNDERLQRI